MSQPVASHGPRPSRRIGIQLPLAIAGVVLAVVVLLSWLAYREVRETSMEWTRDRLEQAGEQIGGLLNQNTEQFKAEMRSWGQEPAVVAAVTAGTEPVAQEARTALEELARSADLIAAVTLWDAAGDLIFEAPGPAAGPEALVAGFRFPHWLGGSEAGVSGFRGTPGGTWFDVAVVVGPEGDEPVGFLVQHRRSATGPQTVQFLSDLIGMNARFVIGEIGGVWTNLVEVLPHPPVDRDSLGELAIVPDDERRGSVGAAVPVSGTPWLVWVEVPMDQVMGRPRAFLRAAIPLGAMVVLLGVLAGLVVSRRITAPLEDLTAAAVRLAEGADAVRVPVEREDEIGELARTFNHMAASLETALGELRRGEERFRHLFASNPLPMWVHDPVTLEVLEVNQAAAVHYGYTPEEFVGLTLADLMAPEELYRLDEEPVESQGPVSRAQEWRHVRADGQPVEVEVTSHPVGFEGRTAALTVVVDVTERKRLEGEVLQAQKLESVGRLAGGIAHDFNNLLTAVRGYSELLLMDFELDDARRADVEGIREAAERAAGLTGQLLAFGRKQVQVLRPMDLNEVVSDLTGMLSRLLGDTIEIHTDLDPELGTVRADKGQMEQVLVNLAVNARDAMPRGGRLTIRTLNADEDELDSTPEPDPEGDSLVGPFVVLEVEDTGVGMEPDVLERLYEPFFTTKPPGKGTGLGLATVYGIVKQSRGHVRATSQLGSGATFRILLPRVLEEGPDVQD